MKNLIALIGTGLLSVSAVSADTLFAPDFSGTSVPTGYTETDASGGSVTYSPGNMTSSDFSVSGAEAYITATDASGTTSDSITTNLSFTPTYTANPADFTYPHSGTAAGVPILDLFTSGASNRPILEISFGPNAYGSDATVDVGAGIGFGGYTSTGTYEFASPGVNSLSGVKLTLDIVTTSTNLGADPSSPGMFLWQITNVGTISDGTSSTAIDLTTVGSAYAGYDPATNPLILDAGITPGTYNGGSGPGAAGFLDPGATIDISNVSVATTTPEPSTCALMFGGLGLLVLLARRSVRA